MDAAVKFPTTPKAVKAAPLKLARRISVEQAFREILFSCIEQVQANEVGVVRFHATESLHQMRVGLRRLRAALAMFEDVIAAPEDIKDELDWLMDQLGPARDWDVLLETTLPRVAQSLPSPSTLAALQVAAQQKAHAFHEQAGKAVSALRYQHLIGKLMHWVEQRGWRDALSAKGKLRLKMRAVDFARAILAQEHERLHRRGRKLKGASPEARHRVRIAAKRVRYAVEFFASLFARKRVRPYLAALASLQDGLGAMNDAAVAERLLAELDAASGALDEASNLVRGNLALAAGTADSSVRTLWKQCMRLTAPR